MKAVIVFAGSSLGSVLALLEQIRSVRECLTHVVCLNSVNQSIFEKSKYVDRAHTLNYITNDEFFEGFKDWFSKQGFAQKPIVYFTTDSSCYLVNNFREWFENYCDLCLPSSSIISTYTQKGTAEKSAEDNGLLIPKTSKLESNTDFENILGTFEFPVIIKPQSTYQAKRALFKVKVLERSAFVKNVKHYLDKGHQFVCQEFIPGGDENAYFFIYYRSLDGAFFSVTGKKILQSPPAAGIMAKGLAEANPELLNLCEKFLDKIDYTGIGGIEFKKHNGNFYFIEMSTRLEGFFKICSNAGVPLGLIAFDDISNSEIVETYVQQEKSEYIDLQSVVSARMRQGAYWKLAVDIFRLFSWKNTAVNVYSLKDMGPFIALIKRYFK